MRTDTIDSVFVFNLKRKNKMLHAELTDKIISSFFKVNNTLGYGFLEKVYENALVIELKRPGFNVLQQQNIRVCYENQVVGNYFADIITDKVILEIKSAEGLREENKAQLINYLKATDKKVWLLLNFCRTPEFIIRAYPSNPCSFLLDEHDFINQQIQLILRSRFIGHYLYYFMLHVFGYSTMVVCLAQYFFFNHIVHFTLLFEMDTNLKRK